MQNFVVVRLNNNQQDVELDKAWQLFKHQAEHNGVRPNIAFSAEQLPAYYQTQVTEVYRNNIGNYVIKTPLAALSGCKGTIPRQMYRQVLSAQFDLGDEAPVDFFDVFNNRYFRLYCQAELKHDLSSQAEEETFTWNLHQQSLTTMLSSLCGLGENNSAIPKQDLIQYTGLLGLKLTCPFALKLFLEDYFDAEFVIKTSELEYQPLTPCTLTQLGKIGQNRQLGMGALVGKSAPMVGQKLHIKVCPRNYSHYIKIRSDRKMISAIEHLVRSYMGINIKYKLYMKVDSRYLPRVQLTSNADKGLKVGQSAWMNSRLNKQQHVEMLLTTS